MPKQIRWTTSQVINSMTNNKNSQDFSLKLKPGKPEGAIQWQDVNGRPVIKSGVGWKLEKKGDDKYLGVLQKQQKQQADAEKNKSISGKILGLLDKVLQKLSSAGLEGVSGNYQTRSQFTGGMDRNPTTKNSESTEVSVPDGWNIKT